MLQNHQKEGKTDRDFSLNFPRGIFLRGAPQRSGFVQRVENLFGKEQKKSPSGYGDFLLGKLRRMR